MLVARWVIPQRTQLCQTRASDASMRQKSDGPRLGVRPREVGLVKSVRVEVKLQVEEHGPVEGDGAEL
jgi:hypothetical protein